MSKLLKVLCLVLLVILAGTIACQPKETELPFETIEQRETAGTGELWEEKEPRLIIIATSEDMAQINNLFTQDAQMQLHELDFDTHFAIAVFLGWQPNGHEGVKIERAARRGDEISVHVQAGNPTGDAWVTSPYHLIQLGKEESWNQLIHFTLYLDGTSIMSLSHFVP